MKYKEWEYKNPTKGTIFATSENFPGKLLGIQANFDDASNPIYVWDSHEGWTHSGKQVADYQHKPWLAIEAEIDRFLDEEGGNEKNEKRSNENDATNM